ncbi:hypothetical protein LLR47_19880 [Bacillus cereus]|uniref:hypothetical protein n=1 Tax=Bacillus cereus TaxID=1396 RepID=UPI001D151A80|nr:hypothetical protein [Bacillus cereus]MCC3687466.1 hypothetical protein [Bacillus cereus]
MFIKILVFILIYMVIGFAWNFAEKIFYGKSTPKLIDDIVAIILTISIYNNIY